MDCELYKFWSREYVNENVEDREDVSKVFALGALFGTVATSDVTISMIMEELEKLEVKDND